MKKMTFTAIRYLNLSIRCEELDTHIKQLYLFLKSTYCEYILDEILSTSEVGPILALIAPSPLTSFKTRMIHVLTCLRNFMIGNHRNGESES